MELNKFGKINGLSETVRLLKSFYDHIIRDETSYNHITKYILSNPANWVGDRLHNK